MGLSLFWMPAGWVIGIEIWIRVWMFIIF